MLVRKQFLVVQKRDRNHEVDIQTRAFDSHCCISPGLVEALVCPESDVVEIAWIVMPR